MKSKKDKIILCNKISNEEITIKCDAITIKKFCLEKNLKYKNIHRIIFGKGLLSKDGWFLKENYDKVFIPTSKLITTDKETIISNKNTGEKITVTTPITDFCVKHNIDRFQLHYLLIGKTKILKTGWFLGEKEPQIKSRKGEKRKPMSEASKLLRSNHQWEGVVVKNYISGKEIILGKNIRIVDNADITYNSLRKLLYNKYIINNNGWFLKENENIVDKVIFSYCNDCKIVFYKKITGVNHKHLSGHDVVFIGNKNNKTKINNNINNNIFSDNSSTKENIIYKIINLHNNKFYIGSSINGAARWGQHKKLLNSNKQHDNIHLQRDWNKFGEECFEFKIIEKLPSYYDRFQLSKVEQDYLNKYCGMKCCYNISHVADRPRSNQKLPIKQLDKVTGQLIKIWPGSIDVEKELAIKATCISAVCRGKKASAGNYKWEYDNPDIAKKYIPNNNTHGGHGKRKVCLIDPIKGKVIEEYSSIEEAAKVNNITGSSIVHVCKGDIPSYKSKFFKYKEDVDKFLSEERITCLICEKAFLTKRKLCSHIISVHEMKPKDYTLYYLNKTNICEHENCNNITNYKFLKFQQFCKLHKKNKI